MVWLEIVQEWDIQCAEMRPIQLYKSLMSVLSKKKGYFKNGLLVWSEIVEEWGMTSDEERLVIFVSA